MTHVNVMTTSRVSFLSLSLPPRVFLFLLPSLILLFFSRIPTSKIYRAYLNYALVRNWITFLSACQDFLIARGISPSVKNFFSHDIFPQQQWTIFFFPTLSHTGMLQNYWKCDKYCEFYRNWKKKMMRVIDCRIGVKKELNWGSR